MALSRRFCTSTSRSAPCSSIARHDRYGSPAASRTSRPDARCCPVCVAPPTAVPTTCALSPSWNPTFEVGFNLARSKHLINASVTYIPMSIPTHDRRIGCHGYARSDEVAHPYASAHPAPGVRLHILKMAAGYAPREVGWTADGQVRRATSTGQYGARLAPYSARTAQAGPRSPACGAV